MLAKAIITISVASLQYFSYCSIYISALLWTPPIVQLVKKR